MSEYSTLGVLNHTIITLTHKRFSGNYGILDGGELSEALEDFMGGVTEEVALNQEKYAAFDCLCMIF